MARVETTGGHRDWLLAAIAVVDGEVVLGSSETAWWNGGRGSREVGVRTPCIPGCMSVVVYVV